MATLRDEIDSIMHRRCSALPDSDLFSTIGSYARTAAEISAGVTPTNYGYAPGDVRRHGAIGNGSTDDTAAINRALSVAQDVFIASGLNCLVSSTLNLRSGQVLYGQGWDSQITCNGTATNAVTLSGLTRSKVRDLFIQYTGTATSGTNGAAVFIGGSSNWCTVQNCRLQGTRAGVTINAATNNAVLDNLIDSINPPDVGWDIAVYLNGSHNLISRNKCFGGLGTGNVGTSGIFILSDVGVSNDWNIISNNEVGTHTQYGILLYANLPGGTAQHNTVVGNIVHDITGTYNSGSGQAYGAGIYVASAEWTTVVGNFFYNTNVSTGVQILAPGAIGIGGVSCFTVVGNVIRFPQWHGIFIATDGNSSGCGLVEGNVITSAGKDGIALGSISNVSVIGNSVTGSTQNGISYTNSAAASGISFIGNKVNNCTGTGFLLTKLNEPIIEGNFETGCANGLNLTNTTDGIILGNTFNNNTSNDVFMDNTNGGFIHFDRNILRSSATNGVNDSIGMVYGHNIVLGQTNPYAGITLERVLATSATPSVLGSRQASYGAATAITDLLNGYAGQLITIRATGAITLNHNAGAASTKLINRGSANLALSNGQTATYELVAGGPWFQVN